MKKLIKPKDVLFLAAANVFDIFEELCDPLGLMSEGCKLLYGWVPPKYRKHNWNHLVWRRLKTGEIEKVIKDNQVYLRLTSAGKEQLKRDFPLLAMKMRQWDKKWRMVFYDIAEVSRYKRDILRIKLQELGFGMIQRSVWITPFDFAKDFREFIKSKDLGDNVHVFESPAFLVSDPKKLASKAWSLEKRNSIYEKIYDELQELLEDLKTYYDRGEIVKDRVETRGEEQVEDGVKEKRKKKEKEDKKEKKKEEEKEMEKLLRKARKLKSQYLAEFIADPHLPKELLPEVWFADEVGMMIKKIDRLMNKVGKK